MGERLPERTVLRGVPYVVAALPASCLPACLTMVAGYLRPHELWSLSAFAERLDTATNDGATLEDGVALMRTKGFRGRVVNASPESRRAFTQVRYCVGHLRLPLIVAIDGGKSGHAVLLVGYDGDEVFIRDPGGAWGGTTMRWKWAALETVMRPGRPVAWCALEPIASPF